MHASPRQHEIGRAWSRGLPTPARTRREQDERFDRAEELAELEAERDR